MNVVNVLISPGAEIFGPNSSAVTPGSSPARRRRGASTIALSRLVYQERCSALPCTTSRAFLITTECTAVIMELTTPNVTPMTETDVPSRKTPMKKPNVTIEHASRIRNEGRACRMTKDVPTVKGRTMPRATW